MATKESTDGPPVQQTVHHDHTGFEELFEKHGKKIIIGVCVLLIAVSAIFIMNALGKEKAKEAARAFTSAGTKGEFEAVMKNYPGSTAAGNALLMLADRLQVTGDEEGLKDAKTKLIQFVTDFKKHPRYYQGVLSLGVVYESLGEISEASAKYKEVAAAGDKTELAPLAIMRQAELAVAAGSLKEANDLLGNIARQFPGTPFFDQIEARIKTLEQKILLAENPPPEPEPEPEPKVDPKTPSTPTAPPIKADPSITPPAPPIKADPSLTPKPTTPTTPDSTPPSGDSTPKPPVGTTTPEPESTEETKDDAATSEETTTPAPDGGATDAPDTPTTPDTGTEESGG